MGGITKKLFGGDSPDPQLEADRAAAQRQAEEEQARQETAIATVEDFFTNFERDS